MTIKILRTIAELRQHVSAVRKTSHQIALVPTMGALHAGHTSLVKAALERKLHVIVSIFVNPTQFAPTEDLSKYPRTFDADRARLVEAGGHAIYLPDAAEMYPQGFAMTLVPTGAASAGLEDRFRPTHFQGVATVVAKLFTQSGAEFAMFGEKDYQQLKVVTRMALDLDLQTTVLPVPTTREANGLAMSSRNVFLTPDERDRSSVLYATMREIADKARSGASLKAALEQGRTKISAAGFSLDYLEARHANTLAAIASLADGPVRLLVAGKIGTTRLIDNIGI